MVFPNFRALAEILTLFGMENTLELLVQMPIVLENVGTYGLGVKT